MSSSYFEQRMAELKANPPKRKWFIDGPLPKAPKPPVPEHLHREREEIIYRF